MLPPPFSIENIPGAGRGVIASRTIPKDSLILRSEPPAALVVFYQYRKEVCAHCFHYDRGRSLPVRLNSAGKVFCSEQCQTQWLEDQGDLGLVAWEQLQLFFKAKSKAITNASGLPLLAPKPDIDEVLSKWTATQDEAETLLKQLKRPSQNGKPKQQPPFQSILSKPWCQAVEPDVLSYLLSGILFHHHHPEKYNSAVLGLAMDEAPSRSPFDLAAHANSYLQLLAIAPWELRPSITSSVCQTLINAASHNSFGLRSGSEDGDEYLGYALFPDASYCNHSCAPNLSKKRVGRVWEFRTCQDVSVGEEMCITYLGGDEKEMNMQQRRERLKEHWGFECACVRCREESSA